MRILGGVAKGGYLQVPKSARPTGVRVRKSLFDLLAVHFPEGSFCDLFAGSGAVGLEAASRGYEVTLVERNTAAVKSIEANARQLNLSVNVVQSAAHSFGGLGSFDILFVDPPFSLDIQDIAKDILGRLLCAQGLCVIQHPTTLVLPEESGYHLERRVYGSNALSLYWKA